MIVVGDACTDDSEDVVRGIGDERVRWENLERNSGSQSVPNNRGIALARGEYIAYLGHDDLWHPQHVAHLVTAIEGSGSGLAIATTLALGPPGSNVRALVTTIPTTPLRPCTAGTLSNEPATGATTGRLSRRRTPSS